jgi:hypothetical protein
VIFEEGLQEKTSALKSGDRRAMENPPFYFIAVVSALRGRGSVSTLHFFVFMGAFISKM